MRRPFPKSPTAAHDGRCRRRSSCRALDPKLCLFRRARAPKLDDEFPELPTVLLETLYPHYLAPLPSMSVVQFEPGATLATVQRLARHSEILAEPINGESCRFRTTQDVEITPLAISGATLSGQPIDAPFSTASAGAASCLRISLRTTSPRPSTFQEMGLAKLQLFISSPGNKRQRSMNCSPIIASDWRWHAMRMIRRRFSFLRTI